MGLNLTSANHVFLYDHWWNPAVMDQAVGRVYRIGQKKPVFRHALYTHGTIEERIHKLLEEKRSIFQELFGQEPTADDEALNRLTDEDLRRILGLDVSGEGNGTSPTVTHRPDPSKPPIEVSPVSHSTQDTVGKPREFSEMSPTEFEEAIRDLFEHLGGYSLTLTKRSHDGGIDLDGYRNDLGGGRIVVQCKRYKDTVSVSAVRDLFGVVSASHDIERGFLVTTSRFSQSSKDFAKDKRITLIDGDYLQSLSRDSKRRSGS